MFHQLWILDLGILRFWIVGFADFWDLGIRALGIWWFLRLLDLGILRFMDLGILWFGNLGIWGFCNLGMWGFGDFSDLGIWGLGDFRIWGFGDFEISRIVFSGIWEIWGFGDLGILRLRDFEILGFWTRNQALEAQGTRGAASFKEPGPQPPLGSIRCFTLLYPARGHRGTYTARGARGGRGPHAAWAPRASERPLGHS